MRGAEIDCSSRKRRDKCESTKNINKPKSRKTKGDTRRKHFAGTVTLNAHANNNCLKRFRRQIKCVNFGYEALPGCLNI